MWYIIRVNSSLRRPTFLIHSCLLDVILVLQPRRTHLCRWTTLVVSLFVAIELPTLPRFHEYAQHAIYIVHSLSFLGAPSTVFLMPYLMRAILRYQLSPGGVCCPFPPAELRPICDLSPQWHMPSPYITRTPCLQSEYSVPHTDPCTGTMNPPPVSPSVIAPEVLALKLFSRVVGMLFVGTCIGLMYVDTLYLHMRSAAHRILSYSQYGWAIRQYYYFFKTYHEDKLWLKVLVRMRYHCSERVCLLQCGFN